MHPICALAEGKLQEWHGLQPFPVADVPACLQYTGELGWLRFRHEPLSYQVYRVAQSRVQVWLFSSGAADVCLVEVFRLPPALDIGPLGPPDLCFNYPLEARMQRPLGDPCEDQQEYVFARHGMSLLVNVSTNGRRRLVRVRGFHPMPAFRYRDRFVDLSPVRWFPEA